MPPIGQIWVIDLAYPHVLIQGMTGHYRHHSMRKNLDRHPTERGSARQPYLLIRTASDWGRAPSDLRRSVLLSRLPWPACKCEVLGKQKIQNYFHGLVCDDRARPLQINSNAPGSLKQVDRLP